MQQKTFNIKIDAKSWKIDEISGYFTSSAILTRAGLFKYRDGVELRPKNEVFNVASLKTLENVPVTVKHPEEEMLTSKTAKNRVVGTVSGIKQDGNNVVGTITLWDKPIIDNVISNKIKQLSCGYIADTIRAPGNAPEFGDYDAVQRNIIYNHVAIVEAGRAGNAEIKIDKKGEDMSNKNKIVVDAEIETEEVAVDAIEEPAAEEPMKEVDPIAELAIKIGDLEKRIAELEAPKADDTVEAVEEAPKVDEVEVKIDEVEVKVDVNELVKERVELLRNAELIVGELKADEMSNEDVMKKVINDKFKELDLEDKSSEYIQARFDTIVETMPAKIDAALPAFVSNKVDEKVSARDTYVAKLEKGEVNK